ncbi:hypothetical protein TNCV_4497991 [Trichonephila clavipes]|nr:hypothetical protein TNCV_4497991 [Trichonephila clavipes]
MNARLPKTRTYMKPIFYAGKNLFNRNIYLSNARTRPCDVQPPSTKWLCRQSGFPRVLYIGPGGRHLSWHGCRAGRPRHQPGRAVFILTGAPGTLNCYVPATYNFQSISSSFSFYFASFDSGGIFPLLKLVYLFLFFGVLPLSTT